MKYHIHTDELGTITKCYHTCKSIYADWKFIIGVTVSFPIEHFIWEKLPGFSYITKFLGL